MNNFELPKHGMQEENLDDMEDFVKASVFDDSPIINSREDLIDADCATPEGLGFSDKLLSFLKLSKKIDDRGNMLRVFTAPETAWVHNLIKLHGKAFDFTGRRYLIPIYNGNQKMILLQTARQVEKSTFLGNKIVTRSAVIPYFRTLYVSPSHIQTRTFSNDRLKPAIESSPIISKYLQNSRVSQQVFEKGFTNGSFIFLRSAFLSADRARGISADQVCLDELQDILISNVPVILQCLSHSKYQYQFFAGTPKTHDNCISQTWERTTQCEWMVPCSHCSAITGKKWNYLDKTNIGLHGPICKYCGNAIDVSIGEWQKAKQSDFYGYRINQLMVPWIVKKESDAWKTLIMQMETYPESQFQNEVLGLAFDNASKPITRAQLMQCCDPNHHFIKDPFKLTAEDIEVVNNSALIGGIDWGEGQDGSDKGLKGKFKTASYTVFTVGAYSAYDKFKVHFMKRFTGKEIDPEYIVNYVAAVFQRLGMKMIGVDWGFGWGVNNALFRKIGPKNCVQFMYVDRQKQTRKWDHIGYKYQMMRNHVISEVFYGLKKQDFVFPRYEEWESFAKDFLNVGVEYSEYQRKMMYVHRSSEPDDALHSLLYCREAAKVFHGRYV